METSSRYLTDQQAADYGAFCNQRITHTQFQNTYAKVANFHLAGKFAYVPGIMTLVGETGAGKSSVVDDYCRDANAKYERHAVVSIVVRESSSVKDLAAGMLRALGDPLCGKGTKESMERRIAEYANYNDVEMFIFDEFQHLTNRGQSARSFDAADWLKTQVEVLRRPFLFVGLPEVDNIFSLNAQLETRRKERVQLAPFNTDTADGTKEAAMFFYMLNQGLPLPNQKASALLDLDYVGRVVSRCGGLVGYMTKVVQYAVKTALLDEADTLRWEHIEGALDDLGGVTFEVGLGAVRPEVQKKKTRKGKTRQVEEANNGVF
ncbi:MULTISPECIES: ATP-binding protein [Thalassospira]|uniref:AAA+ ATPase domain-containing protein n=1 Tax=Thalassospira alkalitolerans TaxID=1293890 RepID=A0A1Y2L7N9_9PROT|nr:ATP-binding protein [Thalassospira alkalitolerans]OSQ42814.1 hypothetical protein TALK_21175 [Thalassospira alkalitolerans]